MKKLLFQVLTGFFAVTLLSTASVAAVKVKGDLADVQTVAVVGYSFLREVQMEKPSLTKLKQDIIPLEETDSEYLMMQEADERVMEVLLTLGSFTVMPREEVLASEFYVSETKDPTKKLNLSWYFPKGYRDIKLKKKNAIALSEELGVDAVVLIHFDSRAGSKSSSWGGVYTKTTKIGALEGEITMFDSSGNELISGKAKSAKTERGTSRGWGDPDSGISVETDYEDPDIDSVWYAMLANYLDELYEDVTQE